MKGSSASALSTKPVTEQSFKTVSHGDAEDGVKRFAPLICWEKGGLLSPPPHTQSQRKRWLGNPSPFQFRLTPCHILGELRLRYLALLRTRCPKSKRSWSSTVVAMETIDCKFYFLPCPAKLSSQQEGKKLGAFSFPT